MPRLSAFFAFTVLFLFSLPLPNAYADEIPAYSPWQLHQTRQNEVATVFEDEQRTPIRAATKEKKSKAGHNPTQIPLSPPSVSAPESKREMSVIEQSYNRRVNSTLQQFGYNVFELTPEEQQNYDSTMPMGALQDDFVLGSGDTLQITFTGQRVDRETYKIGPHGTLAIKDFPPITAAGQTIGQLRETINAHLASLHNTQAYVSLSAIRQISVLIVGNARKPGKKTLNAFHTVLDAIIMAGGIEKDGSLRKIKLIRGGKSTKVDLYDVLMHGTSQTNLQLRDGDRIVIPPIGPTLAVSGGVKRPGIYEIREVTRSINNVLTPNSEQLSLASVLDFAGGVINASNNRFIRLSLTRDGSETVTQITNPASKMFGDNTILDVGLSSEKRRGTVELSGHTRTPGLYDISHHKTLASILQNDQVLGDDIYPLIGVIKRWDNEQLTSRFINFTPRIVLKNKEDIPLQENDVVILLSNTDISDIYKNISDEAESPKNTHETSEKTTSILKSDPDLKFFLKERSVYVRGAVRTPGLYPVAEGATLENLIAVAGGLTLEADTSSIEVTSKNIQIEDFENDNKKTGRSIIGLNSPQAAALKISAGDAIRVNQKRRQIDDRTVLIIGEIARPGKYDLLPGDKISDLISRAGGLTEQAYPAGGIFSRAAERKTEELRFRAAARDMERRLAVAIESKDNAPDATQIAMVRELADKLTHIETVGRIVVEMDPEMLKTKPELDILLEKDDRIYIPKRPLTIRVSGEVLSPASLQFREEKSPVDYIHEAGGFTYHADKDRAFALFPDGSAQPLKVSHWNHTPIMIPPGSTIVIPRDPKPFDFIESAKEVGQILSNLAITAVFIDDIRD